MVLADAGDCEKAVAALKDVKDVKGVDDQGALLYVMGGKVSALADALKKAGVKATIWTKAG